VTVARLELRGLSKRFGSFAAVDDLSLTVAPGEFLTLLGASGSGKTTTLRLIAGFERPTAGAILIDGVDAARQPAFKRPINTVFQQYALFPHLTVAENVAYGLRMRRVPSGEIADRVTRALAMVRMQDFAARAPRQLSGGQQQRVALARALVNEPRVLLLDEPLGALDLKLRREMQLELTALNRTLGITFIYVTHDQEEALTMSDRIALMRGGRIEQLGSPRDLYDHPRSRYVAGFVGETTLLAATVDAVGDPVTLLVAGVPIAAPAPPADAGPVRVGETVWLSLRPEAVTLDTGTATDPPGGAPSGPPGAALNALSGTVREVVYAGPIVKVAIDVPSGATPDGPVVVAVHQSAALPAPVVGTPVRVTWPVSRAVIVRG
jgi:spermidine/putrescine transport system ATP-binding protein